MQAWGSNCWVSTDADYMPLPSPPTERNAQPVQQVQHPRLQLSAAHHVVRAVLRAVVDISSPISNSCALIAPHERMLQMRALGAAQCGRACVGAVTKPPSIGQILGERRAAAGGQVPQPPCGSTNTQFYIQVHQRPYMLKPRDSNIQLCSDSSSAHIHVHVHATWPCWWAPVQVHVYLDAPPMFMCSNCVCACGCVSKYTYGLWLCLSHNTSGSLKGLPPLSLTLLLLINIDAFCVGWQYQTPAGVAGHTPTACVI